MIKKYLENAILDLMCTYNFNYINLPIISNITTFTDLGELSEIVSKQMYFVTYGNIHGTNINVNKYENKVLRPEFTLLVLEHFYNNYQNNKKYKFSYSGNVFRYERKQKYRMREFTQVGCEIINHNFDIHYIIEIIYIAYKYLLNLFNINDIKIRINNIGSFTTKQKYITYLKSILKNDNVKNPIRLLDKKCLNIDKIMPISNFLDIHTSNQLNNLVKILLTLDIPVEIDNSIIRGLDYYIYNVFEISIKDIVVIGGGEYYSHKYKINGVGFSVGIDRVMNLLENQSNIINNNNKLNIGILLTNEQYIIYFKIIDILHKKQYKYYIHTIHNVNINVSVNKLYKKLLCKIIIIISNDTYQIINVDNKIYKRTIISNTDELYQYLTNYEL